MTIETSAAAQMPDAPDSSVRLKRKLAWLGAAFIIANIAPKLGLGLAYTLRDKPWAMMLINPLGIFQAQSAAHDPLWVFLLVGVFRLSLTHPIHFLLGRYGVMALKQPRAGLTASKYRVGRCPQACWIAASWRFLSRQRSRTARSLNQSRVLLAASDSCLVRWLGRVIRKRDHKAWVRRNFPVWGYVFIFLRPNSWMMILAGGFGLRPRYVALASTTGILVWLTLVGLLASYVPAWVFMLTSIF